MNFDEVISLIEKNCVHVNIMRGDEAIKEIKKNGLEDLFSSRIKEEGSNGFFVELVLNEDNACWAYSTSFSKALSEALDNLFEAAEEISFPLKR